MGSDIYTKNIFFAPPTPFNVQVSGLQEFRFRLSQRSNLRGQDRSHFRCHRGALVVQ